MPNVFERGVSRSIRYEDIQFCTEGFNFAGMIHPLNIFIRSFHVNRNANFCAPSEAQCSEA